VSAREARQEALLDELSDDTTVQTAARIAARFNINPLTILAIRDDFELNVLIACAQVVSEDERKQNEQSKARTPRPRRH